MEWEKIRRSVSPYVFRLSTLRHRYNLFRPYQYPNDESHTATGFLLENGWMITNAHVAEGAFLMQAENEENKNIPVEVAYLCKERDIAFLRSELLKKKKGISLSKENTFFLEEPQEVMSLGYPLGQRSLKSTTGELSGWYANVDDTIGNNKMPTFEYSPFYVTMNLIITYGYSGGVILNKQGEAVAIASAGEEESVMQYALPIEYVKQLLDFISHSPEEQVIRLPKYAFDFFPYSTDNSKGGVIIKQKSENSFFQHLDIGDVLLGIHVPSLEYVARVMANGEIELSIGKKKKEKKEKEERKEKKERALTFKEFFQLLPIYSGKLILDVIRDRQPIQLQEIFPTMMPSEKEVYLEYVLPTLEPHVLDYECFGALILMNATYNHFMAGNNEEEEDKTNRNSVGRQQDARQPKSVIIVQILTPSELFDLHIFSEGQTISNINGIAIHTLEDIETARNKKGILIETAQHDVYMCSHERFQKEVDRLQCMYSFYI